MSRPVASAISHVAAAGGSADAPKGGYRSERPAAVILGFDCRDIKFRQFTGVIDVIGRGHIPGIQQLRRGEIVVAALLRGRGELEDRDVVDKVVTCGIHQNVLCASGADSDIITAVREPPGIE